jgi:CO dehydrogenase nickel-insertion accessory protein CooC1
MFDRAMIFANAITWHAMLFGFSTQYLVATFSWEFDDELVVIDVDNGLGHVSRALIDHNSIVKCIVQDSSNVVMQRQENLLVDLRERISF